MINASKVGIWKLRGNLPHPVEATALLTDAILHDDAQKNSIFSIRATYSAAFCRSVTFHEFATRNASLTLAYQIRNGSR
jgi:ribosomal biogenesis protein LAS1